MSRKHVPEVEDTYGKALPGRWRAKYKKGGVGGRPL